MRPEAGDFFISLLTALMVFFGGELLGLGTILSGGLAFLIATAVGTAVFSLGIDIPVEALAGFAVLLAVGVGVLLFGPESGALGGIFSGTTVVILIAVLFLGGGVLGLAKGVIPVRVFGVLVGVLILVAVAGVVSGAGSVGGAADTGTDYAGYASDEAQDELLGFGIPADEIFEPLAQTWAKLKCIGSGPECVRAWRLNNTERPSSEDVGEKYGIEIREFSVAGSRVDISNKQPSYTFPVTMNMFNRRDGLDGINARDVDFRLRIIDSDHPENTPYCDTGWKGINDSDGLATYRGGNDLPPGTAAFSNFLRLDSLSIENCKQRQPGAGRTLRVKLDVRYKYFSQATLYFRAMSRSFARGAGIRAEKRNSRTADTPVQAALGILREPILLNLENPRDRVQIPIQATLNTDEDNVEYEVDDMLLKKSPRTCVLDDAEGGDGDEGECFNVESPDSPSGPGTSPGSGGLTPGSRKPEDDADTVFISHEGNPEKALSCSFHRTSEGYELINGDEPIDLEGDRQQTPPYDLFIGDSDDVGAKSYNFTEDKTPPVAGCIFTLKDTDSISRRGETLTMRLLTNYTVTQSKLLEGFEVLNRQCGTKECPHVFYLEGDEISPSVLGSSEETLKEGGQEKYWKRWEAICDGPDADGDETCTAVKDFNQVTERGFDPATDEENAALVDEGDVALKLKEASVSGSVFSSCADAYSESIPDEDFGIIGVNAGELRDVIKGEVESQDSVYLSDLIGGGLDSVTGGINYSFSSGEWEVVAEEDCEG